MRTLRSGAVAASLAAAPIAAHAASKLPQMDFSNPLTISQVIWMAIIMAVLYVMLRNWLLPQVADVLVERRTGLRRDLDAAQEARQSAEQAVAQLDRAIAEARAESERTVNAAMTEARARADADRAASTAALELELARAEREIANARADAMASLRPIADEVAAGLLERLTGRQADRAVLDRALSATQVA